MGWTETYKPQDVTPKQFLIDRVLNCENEHGTWKVLDAAAKGGVLYAAVERTEPGRKPFVFAAVVLYRCKSRDDYNIAWKDMSEGMGPFECDCPARILDLLSPTKKEYALAWRKRCREKIAMAKSKPKIQIGDKLVFNNPVPFGKFGSFRTFFMTDMRKMHASLKKDGPAQVKLNRRLLADHGEYKVYRGSKKIHG